MRPYFYLMKTFHDQTSILHLENISHTFLQKNEVRSILSDISLTIKEGEFVSFVGPTGCGKSTLLNICAGLVAPSEGAITLFGEPLKTIDQRIGYMFQQDVLLPWFTVLENVVLGLRYRNLSKQASQELGEAWLRRVGLSHAKNDYPTQLSGGMKKRAALAQTLIMNPNIILMDEPFSALDVQTRQLMGNELLTLWEKERSAVLFVTHDLDEAIALSDRVIVLSAGPGAHIMGEFYIPISRPRNLLDIRGHADFITIHQAIWEVLRSEVLKSYQQPVDVSLLKKA